MVRYWSVRTAPECEDGRLGFRIVAGGCASRLHDLMRHTAGFVYGGATKSTRIKQMYAEGNIGAPSILRGAGWCLNFFGGGWRTITDGGAFVAVA